MAQWFRVRMQGDMAALRFDWQQVRLANGLRLITIVRPESSVVAVRVYVRAGSRYDAEQEPDHPPIGLAHCVEHLISKGSRGHRQREVFAAVEHLGGVLEAGTSKEYAEFHAVVPQDGFGTALRVLAELLTEPALREQDFHSEKMVIAEEIGRAADRESTIFELFARTMWQQSPLRHPIRGTLQTLADVQYPAVRDFYDQRYVAGNMLVAICGDIEHDEAEQAVVHSIAGLRPGPEQLPTCPDEPAIESARRAHLERGVSQVVLMIGVPTVSMKHDDRGPLKVMERVLGMGGSARLYQRLREEEGLVYAVRALTAHYEDDGYFAIYLACQPQDRPKVEQIVLEEWSMLQEHGVTPAELEAAKSNYAGTLAVRFETNLAVAGIMGVEALLHQVESFEDAVHRINAVGRDDVQRVACHYLDSQRSVIASVGPGTALDP